MRGSTGTQLISPMPNMTRQWVELVCVYSGTNFTCYTNGVVSVAGEATAATDNGLGLAIGCNPVRDENTWCGQYDEIRLRGGSLSADRIKADYDMIKNRNFLRYGPVERGKGVSE